MDQKERERWHAIGIYPPAKSCGPKQDPQAAIDELSCDMRVIRTGCGYGARTSRVHYY